MRSLFPGTEVFDNSHAFVETNSSDWDEFYRDRWSHDKVVRSAHGVNRTGSCAGEGLLRTHRNGIELISKALDARKTCYVEILDAVTSILGSVTARSYLFIEGTLTNVG